MMVPAIVTALHPYLLTKPEDIGPVDESKKKNDENVCAEEKKNFKSNT